MTIGFRTVVLTFITLSWVCTLSSASETSAPQEILAELSLSPAGCFVDDKKKHCEMKIDVHWRAHNWPPFCLFIDNDETPFFCSEGAAVNSTTLMKTTAHSFSVIWRQRQDQQITDKVDFIVTTDESSRRHRRRHPWSIF